MEWTTEPQPATFSMQGMFDSGEVASYEFTVSGPVTKFVGRVGRLNWQIGYSMTTTEGTPVKYFPTRSRRWFNLSKRLAERQLHRTQGS